MFEIRFHYHPRSKVAEWQTLVFIGVVLRTRWARSQAGKQGSKSHVSSNRLLSSSFHRVYLSSVLDQAFRGLPSDLEVALGSSVVLPCQARETRITTTDKYKKHKDLELQLNCAGPERSSNSISLLVSRRKACQRGSGQKDRGDLSKLAGYQLAISIEPGPLCDCFAERGGAFWSSERGTLHVSRVVEKGSLLLLASSQSITVKGSCASR